MTLLVTVAPTAALTVPASTAASLVSEMVYPSTPAGPTPPVLPVAPSWGRETVSVSAMPLAVLDIFTAIVRAVIVAPVIVTTFPVLLTPGGTVWEKTALSTLYSYLSIVVLVAVPVTVAVVGVVAPTPPAGAIRDCEVA